MRFEMKMPQMGESIAEATVLRWLKNVGDSVSKDETILEISTDKVDSEIPAPESGVIVELIANEGDTVAVLSVIAVIETDASAAASAPAASPAPTESAATGPAPATPQPQAAPQAAPEAAPTAGVEAAASSASSVATHVGDKFISPLVRSLAAQHGVSEYELNTIQGTGSNGRVTKNDFQLFLAHRKSAGTASAAPAVSAPAPAIATPVMSSPVPATVSSPTYGADGTAIEPMDRMRQLIADHMVRSKATSPHVYSVAEIDVTNISLARKKNQAAFVAREGFKLSYTSFFLQAAVKGLLHCPQLNSSVDGTNIILKKDINLGCAVALGTTGLIVPVIKNASELSLVGIARTLNDLAARARSKNLSPDEVQGGTFTVTNVGTFGNIIGYPIINQPQVGILALGAIKKRPVVVDGMIAIRDIVYITLSYDHRIIDGSTSGSFLKFVTEYLENFDPNAKLV